MGGRADEDEDGNAPPPPPDVPAALARYRAARERARRRSTSAAPVDVGGPARRSVMSSVRSFEADALPLAALENMRVGAGLDDDEDASSAASGSSSSGDEDDDGDYMVFGRATIKAQSLALSDVGAPRGDARGPWRGRVRLKTRSDRPPHRAPLQPLGDAGPKER